MKEDQCCGRLVKHCPCPEQGEEKTQLVKRPMCSVGQVKGHPTEQGEEKTSSVKRPMCSGYGEKAAIYEELTAKVHPPTLGEAVQFGENTYVFWVW